MFGCRQRLLAVLAALAVAASAHAQDRTIPTVAAAADLKFALEEVAARYRAETAQEVRLIFGSSGSFAAQLRQGAPFQIFLSADEGFVFQLADAGLTIDRGSLYAEGRIVLFAPNGSSLKPDAKFDGLRAALKDGRIRRFAMANPEHAPYGRAAEQALTSQGLWEAIKPRIVLGENVSQAAQFAASGSADGGIIAYSLALAPTFAGRGSYALIPGEFHAPLRQRMVLLHHAGETARAFYDYLRTPSARTILRKYGFATPHEAF